MKITREIIEGLREGDLVRLQHRDWMYPIEGKLFRRGKYSALEVGGFSFSETSFKLLSELWDIEILERAPRFYANVDRPPVPGDVCRLNKPATIDATNATTTWTFRDDKQWWPTRSNEWPISGDFGIQQPVLIVDGTNGLPVMPKVFLEELSHLRAVADL